MIAICVHLRLSALLNAESKPSINIEQIAKRFGLSQEALLDQRAHALLLREIGELEREIAGLRERYSVLTPEELKQAMDERRVPEHPTWEDYIDWLNMTDSIHEIKTIWEKMDESPAPVYAAREAVPA